MNALDPRFVNRLEFLLFAFFEVWSPLRPWGFNESFLWSYNRINFNKVTSSFAFSSSIGSLYGILKFLAETLDSVYDHDVIEEFSPSS